MNPVKRERIQQAVNRYKKFKDEVEHRRLKEEIERLMSLPWPFKVKTVEAARDKVYGTVIQYILILFEN